MRTVTATQFAKERGVAQSRVTQWRQAGRLKLNDDGRILADESHASLDRTLDHSRGIRATGNVTSRSPKARKDAAKARKEAKRNGKHAPQVPKARGTQGDLNLEGSSEGSDFWAHRTRREKADAQLREMRAAEMAGKLVKAEEVRELAVETARRMRNALLALPDQLAPVLDPASPDRAHRLLTTELTKVLADMERALRGSDADPATS